MPNSSMAGPGKKPWENEPRAAQDAVPPPLERDRSASSCERGTGKESSSTRHRDGTPVVVASHWAAELNEADELVAVLEVNNDITETRKAKEALKLSEQRYKALTELIPQLVWTSLPDGRIDYASPRWLEYTGFTDEQFQGDGWAGLPAP